MALVWKASLVLIPALAAILGLGFTYFDWYSLWQPAAAAFAGPQTFLFSEEPLVVYVKNFITPDESAHLVGLADPRFKPSVLWDDKGKVHRDSAYRSSMTARLPKDSVVKRIEERARAFPFYKNLGDFQPMVVQNYGTAGQYRDHYDWYGDSHTVGGNIASTFFVYIYANCTGGGTNFPRIAAPQGEEWCEFIDCDRPFDEGVTFKPILGNAVYWDNLDGSGVGYPATLHAGMPVTSGNKMGLNLWTWQNAGAK